ncbi:hypothetical protein [Devosia soli]|uniref:hypothetical protein n=1 Tax=Devosia soli TaxID=361041 RepID=UPI0013792072|nr:hypothetical protein [Devosia soli]
MVNALSSSSGSDYLAEHGGLPLEADRRRVAEEKELASNVLQAVAVTVAEL